MNQQSSLKKESKNRIEWIDIARGIAILFVCLGHRDIPPIFSKWIYTFHMPIFFFISGYITKYDGVSFGKFMNKKLCGLVIPYFSLGAVYIFSEWIYSLCFHKEFNILEWLQKLFIGQKIKLPDYVNLINTNDKKDDKIIEKQKSDNNKSGLINNSISNKAFSLSKNNSDNSKKTSINQDTFIWPVRGKVINKFGAITNGGEKNLGVNIATKHLEKVKAASSGTIRFVDKIDGYGEVIIMQHNNDFFTAYGFIDPLVSVNDKVKKGQIIASVKNNDNSNRSILYFSIRKGKKSYNPEEIIVNQL